MTDDQTLVGRFCQTEGVLKSGIPDCVQRDHLHMSVTGG